MLSVGGRYGGSVSLVCVFKSSHRGRGGLIYGFVVGFLHVVSDGYRTDGSIEVVPRKVILLMTFSRMIGRK